MRRQLRRLWRAARLLCHLGVGVVLVQLCTVRYPTRSASRHCHRGVVQWWARRLCRIINLRVQVEGQIVGGPVLFVANHVSWLDIPGLLWAVDATFVAKQEIRDWPLVGTLVERAGTLFLSRGARDGAAATAERMTWLLQQQRSVIIFPEGTTTDGSHVKRFHARLFQAAVHTGAPVQAVAIEYPSVKEKPAVAPFVGDDKLVPHIWRLLGEERICVRVSFCAPIRSHGSRQAVANLARHQICAMLGLDGAESMGLSTEYTRRTGQKAAKARASSEHCAVARRRVLRGR